jgi:hypothetical protein
MHRLCISVCFSIDLCLLRRSHGLNTRVTLRVQTVAPESKPAGFRRLRLVCAALQVVLLFTNRIRHNPRHFIRGVAMTLSLIYRGHELRRFFEACKTRRTDIALIGDSNMFSAGTSGHAMGFEQAWGRRFGLYATGVRMCRADASWAVMYHAYSFNMDADAVPASHAHLLPPGAMGSAAACKLGAFGGGYASQYYALLASHPNTYTAALRWVMSYGTFASGTGVFTPTCRGTDSLAYYASGPAISTNTGQIGAALAKLDVPAGGRGQPALCFAPQGVFPGDSGTSSGPFVGLWQRIVWPGRETGVGVSPLVVQGGAGTRQAALLLQGTTPAQFGEWLRVALAEQVGPPMLMIQLIQGQNDTADAAPSAGPSPAPSNTPAGVADNTRALIDRLRALWSAAGHSAENLWFLVGPYHPQDETRRQWGRDLDEALFALARAETNVAVASRSRLSTSAYFRHRGWYAGGAGDDAHLTVAGYQNWAQMSVDAVVPTPRFVVRHATGATLDLMLFDESGQVYDAVRRSFGPWSDDDRADYCIAGQEQGGSGVYLFPLPEGIAWPAGLRGIVTERAGASPDPTDATVATPGPFDFDGLSGVGVRHLAEAEARQSSFLREQLDVPVSLAGTGGGRVAVDHNTGGVDALRYVAGPAGVGGAEIRAYVKADYDAGEYVIRARTTTRDDGRWVSPMYLNAGVTYTLTFAKPGRFEMSRRDVGV